MRSVAYVDCAQCILLALGIVVLGFIALDLVGGWTAFKGGLTALAEQKPDMVAIPTRPESDSFLERVGTLFFDAQGGPWTGLMILTYMFALMGIQSAPAFSMWAFANRDPRPFPWQQVFRLFADHRRHHVLFYGLPRLRRPAARYGTGPGD